MVLPSLESELREKIAFIILCGVKMQLKRLSNYSLELPC